MYVGLEGMEALQAITINSQGSLQKYLEKILNLFNETIKPNQTITLKFNTDKTIGSIIIQ